MKSTLVVVVLISIVATNAQVAAIVTKITSPVIVRQGERAIPQCHAEGVPNKTAIIRWERNGVVLRSKEFANRAVLEIDAASVTDSGSYWCIANNGVGQEDRAEALLLVRRPPTIEQGAQFGRGAGKVGSALVLRCRASGVPEVHFTWRRMSGQSHYLENSTGFLITHQQIDHSTFESNMTIRQLTEYNYNEMYACLARNALGSDTIYVKVLPVRHPDKPTDLSLSNVTDTTVTIEWKAGFDGGSSQVFHVRYRAVDAIAHNYINVTSSEGHTRFTISDLLPSNEYAVQVGARNEMGDSGYQPVALMIRTLTSDRFSWTQFMQMIQKEVPVIVIVLVAIVGVVLLMLIIYLVCSLIRRNKRKKMNGLSRYRVDYQQANLDEKIN